MQAPVSGTYITHSNYSWEDGDFRKDHNGSVAGTIQIGSNSQYRYNHQQGYILGLLLTSWKGFLFQEDWALHLLLWYHLEGIEDSDLRIRLFLGQPFMHQSSNILIFHKQVGFHKLNYEL